MLFITPQIGVDYDELMASHAAVGESPNDPDSPQNDGDTLPYRWAKCGDGWTVGIIDFAII